MLVRILLVWALLAVGPPVGLAQRVGAFNMSRSDVAESGAHHSAREYPNVREESLHQGAHQTSASTSTLTNPEPQDSKSSDSAPLPSRSRPEGSKLNQSEVDSKHTPVSSVPSSDSHSLPAIGDADRSSSRHSSNSDRPEGYESLVSGPDNSSPKKNRKSEENKRSRRDKRRRAKERRKNSYSHENFVVKDRNQKSSPGNFSDGPAWPSGGSAWPRTEGGGSKPSNERQNSLIGRSSPQSRDRNDSLSQDVQNDGRNPYRHMGEDDDKVTDRMRPAFWSGDIQVGCRELRARRYITDGFCTSEKPIKEVVCAGHCLPIMEMPWYAEFIKTLARTKLREYQCVEDLVRKKKVRLLCQNGELRFYKIKVVKSCKCKRIVRKHNRTAHRRRNGKKRRKQRRRKNRKNKRGRVS